MTQDDARARIARRIDVYRTDRRGLVQRLLELGEVARACRARLDVRGDQVALVRLEAASA
jgi:hypothetical protein